MRVRQVFRRLLTRTRYSLATPLARTTIRGKDWSFLENFDDLGELAKFDFQIETLYRSRLKNLRLVKAGHYDLKSYAVFRKFDVLFDHKHRFLVCIPWLRVGGAERVRPIWQPPFVISMVGAALRYLCLITLPIKFAGGIRMNPKRISGFLPTSPLST